ncbi:hypothetical protein PMJEKBHI_01644 [Lacticaseibacillus rhamnosus]|nr:hypothetical protein PMJEKBHI_01644 [Lacticaseibacillus rhamnosus]VEF28931.1 Uncharacterised protein [Lacticaseibacillus rhamnosus]VEF59266.1 Uncharacterised protein [Lacticaseibacillus rhamnosus]VTU52454.1 hypothetical protein AMBR_DPAELIID_02565 [Lacticaseibacillus rhamnosus]VTU54296.1 hypothetical protein AMBR_JPGBJEAN_01525 [Lacticaseibacillus rhamnosus]
MALSVMAGLWPLRLRSLHADFCAGERVMGVNQNISGLETKWLGYGHLVSRSLHAGFWAGERVMGVNQNISGLERGDRVVVNTSKVLTCRFPDFRSRKRVSDPKPISDVAFCTYNHILKPSVPTLATRTFSTTLPNIKNCLTRGKSPAS